MGRRVSRRKSRMRQSKMCSFLIVVAVIIVCFATTAKSLELSAKSRELTETEITLERKVEAAKIEAESLVAQEQYMNTKKYIEDVAKDKLGLVYPDEILIKAN